MPARTLGSWEAMTSDIISGNSTFMESAWMKVLRQNRLIFFTICHTREIPYLCVDLKHSWAETGLRGVTTPTSCMASINLVRW